MSPSDTSVTADAQRALEGAARVVERARFCWLATQAEGGAVAARPMGRVSESPQKTGWKIAFVTDGRSWKASAIRRLAKATLIFQVDGEDAYAALSGVASLCEDRAEVHERWRAAFDPYFPTDLDRANAAFVDVAVERMDLWIKGTTPEPFGLATTTLLKDEKGGWRLA